jgi:hypothetical protein
MRRHSRCHTHGSAIVVGTFVVGVGVGVGVGVVVGVGIVICACVCVGVVCDCFPGRRRHRCGVANWIRVQTRTPREKYVVQR